MLKDENTRNTVIAIALSLAVLLGWQYFVVAPRVEQDMARQAATQPVAVPSAPSTSGAAVSSSPVATPAPIAAAPAAPVISSVQDRAAALASTARVQIDTPRLQGSINLKNGRLDDLSFKDYHEKVEKTSPRIVLLSPSGTPAPFYAEFGVVGTQGSTLQLPNASTLWTQKGSGALTPQTPVTLTYDNGQGLVFEREYSVDSHYMFTLTERVRNNTAATVAVYPYALVSRHGTPKTEGFYVLHEGLIGVLGEAGLKEVTYADLEKKGNIEQKATKGWLGITDKYWAAAVIPDQTTSFAGHLNYHAPSAGGMKTYQADYLQDLVQIAANETVVLTHRVFAGAKEADLIKGYAAELSIDRFDLMIDWGWFYFITKPMFSLLKLMHAIFGNFGVAILLVTVVVKLIFYPLANKSYESMSKMKKVQPEMVRLREVYAEDKVKQQQEMMELYRREKINPLSGCLPVIIQIPVFFALYKVLFVSIEMRHAPFFGWIKDLAAADPSNMFNLFGLLPFDPTQIPLFGPFLHLGVWPLLMGVSMWVQMKMNPEPTDPTQKIMFAWMPLIFTFMLASFPAGLVIYWTWNNLLSVAQQYFIMNRLGVKVELWDNLKSTFRRG